MKLHLQVATFAVATVSCVGQIGESPDTLAPTEQCGATWQPTTAVRRLSRVEYANSVRDLLAVEPPAASALPDDGVALGFTTTIGQALTSAAVGKYFDAADAIAAKLDADTLVPCPGADTHGCVRSWLQVRAARFARRPLTDDELGHFTGLYDDARSAGDSHADAVGVVLRALLTSPQFLFVSTINTGGGSALYGLASFLSYSLWRTTPDDTLLAAAADGSLANQTVVEAQIARLIEDERAQEPLRSFVDEWLQLGLIDKVNVRERHPEATPEVIAALAAETRAFVDDALFTQRDLRRLFVSPTQFRNRLLSEYYGDGLGADDTLRAYTATPGEKSFGLLSQAGVLMAATRNEDAAIIYRGKYVRVHFLCGALAPPPAGIPTALPSTNPFPTSRERIADHTKADACQSCHTLMNPIGFALGHFDGSGRWQDKENGVTIDTTATIDELGAIDGGYALSRSLAESKEVQACVASTVLTMARAERTRNADACLVAELSEQFARSGYDVAGLLAAVVRRQASTLRGVTQ